VLLPTLFSYGRTAAQVINFQVSRGNLHNRSLRLIPKIPFHEFAVGLQSPHHYLCWCLYSQCFNLVPIVDADLKKRFFSLSIPHYSPFPVLVTPIFWLTSGFAAQLVIELAYVPPVYEPFVKNLKSAKVCN